MKRKILVVLSGGQDSTTCLYIAKSTGAEVSAITFDYGQRHRIEIESAIDIAQMAGVDHKIVKVPNCLVSASPLTSTNVLETYKDYEQMDEVIGDRIEKTFVPMRNALFLTIAANRAVELGCNEIMTGICQQDNANYPDCREDFRESFEVMVNRALGNTSDNTWIHITAPLIDKSKAESIHLAKTIDGCMLALAYSHTSYDGKYPPTDMNHSNVLRAKGFEEAGIPDPLVVRAWWDGSMALPVTDNYSGIRNYCSEFGKDNGEGLLVLKALINEFCVRV